MDSAKSQQQEAEWREAQSIAITADLVSLAKRQLFFLAAVDRHRSLYQDGPVLRRAINRYKNCWLPLLAKHQLSGMPTTPLVVPLDCEWIWHCHRLHPVQYKKDCESIFGKILGNRNVRSTIEEETRFEEDKSTTVDLWEKSYPGEPFELDYTEDRIAVADSTASPLVTIDYDLVAAVQRQSSFCYQVSSPSMNDRQFLQAAFARYKGFLHLIRRNGDTVPTYDVDLIWHTHQLQPLSYSNDLTRLVGRLVDHDDTTSHRGKGSKLEVGFKGTTELWAETFGSRYWKAGAMYRGSAPSPVVTTPYQGAASNILSALPCSSYQKQLPLSNTKFVEVLLEVVDVKNIPDKLRGSLFVSYTKNSPDSFFHGGSGSRLRIQSESGQEDRAIFRCEPTGDIILSLGSEMSSFFPVPEQAKNIGTVSISLEDIVEGESKLPVEKWFEVKMEPGSGIPMPISLRVAVSSTVAAPAPYVFLPFPATGHQQNHLSRFVDASGNEIVQMSLRFSTNKSNNGSCTSKAPLTNHIKHVVGSLRSTGENHVLAEFVNNAWSFLDSKFILPLDGNSYEDGPIFELQGEHLIKLFRGRRLEFEVRSNGRVKQENEHDFITVVQFSSNEPYGKVLALVNIKTGYLKVSEEWFVLPGLVLTFILWRTLKSEGCGILTPVAECQENIATSTASMCEDAPKMGTLTKFEKIALQGSACMSGCMIMSKATCSSEPNNATYTSKHDPSMELQSSTCMSDCMTMCKPTCQSKPDPPDDCIGEGVRDIGYSGKYLSDLNNPTCTSEHDLSAELQGGQCYAGCMTTTCRAACSSKPDSPDDCIGINIRHVVEVA